MGRPVANTGKKRVKLTTTVAPTTDQWLKDVWFKHGISKGDMFDRLVNRYGNELLGDAIETRKAHDQQASRLTKTRSRWPYPNY